MKSIAKIRHFRFAALGGILAVAAGLGLSSVPAAEPDDVFGEKVRAYLLKNPEVILEVMNILGARQEELAIIERIKPHVPTLFATQMDLRMGRHDAPQVIIEFFDYNCAACRANMPVLRAFVDANPDVAIVKKHLPILSPSSERAARFVLAARMVSGDAAYQELHSALYEKMGVLSIQRLREFASELGLDAQQIEDQMQHPDISAVIDIHRDLAIALQVIGTPTFMTKRAIVEGNVTAEILTGMLTEP